VISCGARGMLYVELRVKTLERDLHSMLGGIVPNAAWRLVEALHCLRDPDGRVLVEGMLERVRPFTESERAAVGRLEFNAEEQAESWGAPYLLRDLDGQEALEELLNRPTANIAGIWGSYTNPGAKTVVPAEATAKMDFRLVPDMTADEAYDLVTRHLKKHGFGDVQVERLSGQNPGRTPVDDPIVRTAEEVWRGLGVDDARVLPNMEGTGPISITIDQLGIPTVGAAGVSWSGDRIHSPNESIRKVDYLGVVRYWGHFIARYADL